MTDVLLACVRTSSPFHIAGADCEGTFIVRDAATNVFVCLLTKTVHLELTDLSTQKCMSLIRFVTRRQKQKIHSETNFVGVDSVLRELSNFFN